MNDFYVNKTIVLWQCPASDHKGNDIKISGLYFVDQFCPYEPSNYVWSACYDLCPAGLDFPVELDKFVSVDVDRFTEQVDPQSYGRQLVQEREMDFYEEDRDEMEVC
jgi:hypothetical protein